MDRLLKYLTDPLFLALVAFLVLLITFNILQRLGRGSAWKQIVSETGLQLSKHRTATYRDQQLSGIYRKRPLTLIESVSQEQRRQNRLPGESRDIRTNTSTDIRLKINLPQGTKLRLYRVITIGETASITGDAEIDRRFNITSEPKWLAQRVLTFSNVRQKLPRLKMGGNIFVQDAEILFSQPGRIPDGKYLRFLFDFLSDLADAVETAAGNVS